MDRRTLLKSSMGALAAASLPRIGQAQDKGQVVIASFGGRYQDAQRKIFFEPFTAATGIKVVEVSGISIAKIQSMARANNMEWDLFVAVPNDMLVLAGQGLLEKIDYSKIDPTALAGFTENGKHPYGVGGMYISQVVAFSTKAFPAGGPQPNSWADIWDTAKFPGKRMLPAGDYSVNPIEAAIMADGVPPSQVYPIDLARAYKSLTRIKPSVVKWANSSSAVPQALVDQEIVAGYANSARLTELKEQGAPVDFSWNQGIIFGDFWSVPKGAPNYANAMKFIEFASRPEQQAAFCKIMPAGPANANAFDFLTAAERARSPSAPENLAKQVILNADWWAAQAADGKTNWNANAAMWNRWIVA